MREYDAIAEWYASDRDRQTGVPEVTALAASLSPCARVLDVGCGTGLPLTRTLLNAGHAVVGLDSSREMLSRFHVNFPDTPVIRGTVQTSPFADGAFDAAVALGIIFHLTLAEQAQAFASVWRVLRPGAPFLFTSGDAKDADGPSIEGTMNGVVFHYYSLSADGYRRLLSECGFTFVDTHADRGENIYYLARKVTV